MLPPEQSINYAYAPFADSSRNVLPRGMNHVHSAQQAPRPGRRSQLGLDGLRHGDGGNADPVLKKSQQPTLAGARKFLPAAQITVIEMQVVSIPINDAQHMRANRSRICWLTTTWLNSALARRVVRKD